MSKPIALGAIKLEPFPRGPRVQVILHSTTGMQELEMSLAEWEQLERFFNKTTRLDEVAKMIAKQWRERCIVEPALVDVLTEIVRHG